MLDKKRPGLGNRWKGDWDRGGAEPRAASTERAGHGGPIQRDRAGIESYPRLIR